MDKVNDGVAERLLAFSAEMRHHADTDEGASRTHRLILQWAHGLETVAAMHSAHPSRGVVDERPSVSADSLSRETPEIGLRRVLSLRHDALSPLDRGRIERAIAALQAAALPAVPDAGANGAAFNVGDRVVWTSRFGREFPGVIESVIQPVPTRYTVSLDDGCHADCDAWNLAATQPMTSQRVPTMGKWEPQRGLIFWRLERRVFSNFAGGGYKFLRYRYGVLRRFWSRKQAQERADQLNKEMQEGDASWIPIATVYPKKDQPHD